MNLARGGSNFAWSIKLKLKGLKFGTFPLSEQAKFYFCRIIIDAASFDGVKRLAAHKCCCLNSSNFWAPWYRNISMRWKPCCWIKATISWILSSSCYINLVMVARWSSVFRVKNISLTAGPQMIDRSLFIQGRSNYWIFHALRESFL